VSAAQAQEPQVAQVPDVHVVVEGETLWDLAARYFGDPFLWPEIYRINTTVVEDPHWIFPGEELRLAALEAALAAEPGAEPAEQPEVMVEPGVEQVQEAARGEPPEAQQVEPGEMAPPVAPPPPPSADAPTIFAQRGTGLTSVVAYEAVSHRAAKRSEFYSTGFLTEGQALPWGTLLGRVGQERLSRLPESSFATVFAYVGISPPEGATYQVGDSLLTGVLLRKVSGWGDIFYPTGLVRVTEVSSDQAIGQVLQQYQRITDDQLTLPVEPFSDPGDVLPVPVENGMIGSIIEARQLNPVPSQQQVVFIDLGRVAGVVPGDMFAVLKMDKGEGMEPRHVAYLRITHVRDESSTGLIVNIVDLGIEAGAPVQLVRKMP
jgi:hypothetical protein